MNREQELEAFIEKAKPIISRSSEEIFASLVKYQEEWESKCLEALSTISHKILEEEKLIISYLQFSLLRIDLWNEKRYHIVLTAYDPSWFLDEEALEVSFELSDWFQERVSGWDTLYEEIRESMGKVTRYDVDHFVMEELMKDMPVITLFLRFLLKDIEEKEWFQEIPKSHIFQIRFGEYHDKSELLLRIDHSEKTQKQWDKEVRLAAVVKDQLVYSGWYQITIKQSSAENLQMHYIRFEDCELNHVSFAGSILYGAKFIHCRLNQVDFSNANLSFVDFTDSILDEVCFEGADMTNVVVSEEMISHLVLSKEQQGQILIGGRTI